MLLCNTFFCQVLLCNTYYAYSSKIMNYNVILNFTNSFIKLSLFILVVRFVLILIYRFFNRNRTDYNRTGVFKTEFEFKPTVVVFNFENRKYMVSILSGNRAEPYIKCWVALFSFVFVFSKVSLGASTGFSLV